MSAADPIVIAFAIGGAGWVVAKAIEDGAKRIAARIDNLSEQTYRTGDKVDRIGDAVYSLKPDQASPADRA